MKEIQTACGNCYFCYNGQCNYAGNCYGSKKWSDVFEAFVPINFDDTVYTNSATTNVNNGMRY